MKGIHCAFEGKIYRDAEVRTSKAGREWMILHVAVGEEEPQFISVAAFRDSFVDLAPHLKQGTAIYAEGSIKLRRWQTADGQASELSCVASLIQPLGLIGQKRPKQSRTTKKAGAKVDSQAPIGHVAPAFNDSLDDLFPA